MHLLATTPGTVSNGTTAMDLAQTPGDIIILSAADTELAAFADARLRLVSATGEDAVPSLRLANLLQLGHNYSVDLYIEATVRHARLVVIRLLGGSAYWPYGIEQISSVCRSEGILLAVLPGDDQPDPELTSWSTVSEDACHRLWQYGVHGGPANTAQFLGFAASLIGHDLPWREPKPLLRAGLYWPGIDDPDLAQVRAAWTQIVTRTSDNRPVAALVFYRALVQAGNVAVIDALINALADVGLSALPVYVASLKDPVAAATLTGLLDETGPAIALNATGFAVSAPGATRTNTPFDGLDAPVLQVVFASGDEAAWRDGTYGLSARDIAMNVALPEVDGRIIGRAVSFKGLIRRDAATECDLLGHVPVPDRVRFVATLAAAWVRIRLTPPAARRIALILANYPNRDGRLGNGVGLDTPAATIRVLAALAEAGYSVQSAPKDGDDLVRTLQAGPTNDLKSLPSRIVRETLPADDYKAFFSRLPADIKSTILERWGPVENDPYYRSEGRPHIVVSAFRCGHVAIGLQPARGYNIDPSASYHDPALPPPHAYLAFYVWLRTTFGAHAVVHMGKHGNLEWLPGKALALSDACFPEVALGPTPNLYPFIVNDPGEGTQAKRRAQAVIIDHLTPPLTRAESYGPLRDLEQLVDEYYEAAGVDPRRLKVLTEEILSLCRVTGLDVDCGIDANESPEAALGKLDNYLCELKELQIRDGLHVFGQAPTGDQRRDLLVALVRVPRGAGAGGDASLLRALANDLALAFDPLDARLNEPWTGPRPCVLTDRVAGDPWRTVGDTVERLECLAAALVDGTRIAEPTWQRTGAVLATLETTLGPAVAASGAAELAGLLAGLDGRFVAPGPSGAPTRGRLDVLPTGRNFYSVDTRTVPTPAAWTLGWRSASLLIERFVQDHGTWPKTLAISAWGTANMRTGGDDLAQALALMGVRPTWDSASRRVTGFEILPIDVLDRPRVDVTLRISGFFRDAFPALIALFDSAARAVAALPETAEQNPLAARVATETETLIGVGMDEAEARRSAGFRVFGSKPGAYGAGLQALIDERGWDTERDLARAYVAWGGWAYGATASGGPQAGEAAHGSFERRLATVEAVVQNQDNREHDLLDSDDYYQFEGGLTAAVRVLSGQQPTTYHPDHARPESPVIRTLEEEVARVVRARVVNPKWISGVMRHGYKGGFEMAATVDYLFAFAATAGCVRDHHFDSVFQAFLDDSKVRAFLETHNPAALGEMADRLLEASARGLWHSSLNHADTVLRSLASRAFDTTNVGGTNRTGG